jgi:hypothetical protein
MSRVDADILTEDARAALLELARLLGRMAAEDAVDHSTLDTSPFHSQKKGACDDKQ